MRRECGLLVRGWALPGPGPGPKKKWVGGRGPHVGERKAGWRLGPGCRVYRVRGGGGEAVGWGPAATESRRRGNGGETARGPGCQGHFFFYLGSAEQSGEQGRVRRKVDGAVELGGVSSGAAGMERCGEKGTLGAGFIGGGGDGVPILLAFRGRRGGPGSI
ncbi:hypothetical protein E2562_025496 [Oryza meyeriana var. granulata]|uniref:Uncharacterized protein n=1 Tax=Oryza meyeriana var. granulata TaxID=110450 RepID=A0A6G1CIF9_9ORYZ|nr:hypothetical protein E2562_025496 [Oryza meyeriana var. granulata]